MSLPEPGDAAAPETADVKAYIGLGSNLGDPVAQVRRALEELECLPRTRVLAVSSLYRNPPMGPQDQPAYVNAVAAIATGLAAEHLLDELLAIEAAHGRRRGEQRWGPRQLDLDLLLYGDQRIDTGRLQVPHPGVGERRFVLAPLAEIDPELRIAGLGSVRSLLARCPDTPMQRI